MPAWIWDAFHRQTPNQLILFRRELDLEVEASAGTIEIAARGSYRLWVNGAMVAHRDLQSPAPGSESLLFDLTPWFDRRRREVTIVIGVYLLGVGTHHQQQTEGGLFVSGAVTDALGREHRIDSSPEWTTNTPAFWRQNAPQMSWTTGFSEWWDHSSTPGDVSEAVLGDGWGEAVVYPDPDRPTPYDRDVVETERDLMPDRVEHGSLHPHEGSFSDRASECVALGARRLACDDGCPHGHPVPGAGGYNLFSVPHQLVGFLTVEIDAEGPGTVDVIAGEALDHDGWPTATRQGIAVVDTITVSKGRTRHRFWHRRTFRHLAVIARGGTAVRLRSASFQSVTAARPDPAFRSGVERYDRLYEVSVRTAEVGRQDFYEDCPLREGGHYVADARIQALFDLAGTGESSLARRSLLQFARAQDPDGMIPALTPSGTHHRLPDFALQWVQTVDDYVRFTGDLETLESVYPGVVAVMAWADTRWDNSARHFSVDEPGWWPFIDWHDFAPDALEAAIDAQYVVTVSSAVALAERAGDSAGASRYRARLAEALLRFTEPCVHPHAAVILLCGLDIEIARDLVAPDVLHGFTVQTGYFLFSLCLAHLALDDAEAAWNLLVGYWGSMLDEGAGTWWERYDPDPDVDVVEATQSSLCHPWSAGPVVLLPMLLSGVNPFARSESRRSFDRIPLGAPRRAILHTPWGVFDQDGSA